MENPAAGPGEKKEQPRGKAKEYLINASIVLLLVISAFLGWKFLEQKAVAEKETAAKEALRDSLNQLLTDYATARTENEALSLKIDEQKVHIEEMLKEIAKLRVDSEMLKKYKKESETLRRLLKGYLTEIDSLNKANIALQEETTELQRSLTQEKKRTGQLTREKAKLTQTVEQATRLTTYGISVTGLRIRGGGKREIDETRARRVDKIKTCFTIAANDLARSGEKNIYIRVAGEDGNVFPKNNDSSYVFMYEKKEIVYSAMVTVVYENLAKEVCLYFARPGGFTPQQYTVDIFADEEQIGEGLLKLE